MVDLILECSVLGTLRSHQGVLLLNQVLLAGGGRCECGAERGIQARFFGGSGGQERVDEVVLCCFGVEGLGQS
jgi:hypothetical protein